MIFNVTKRKWKSIVILSWAYSSPNERDCREAGYHFSTHYLKWEQSPGVQSLEPIFFPKLQIYFADFPNLHCRVDQSSLNLETCCGY